MTLNMSVLAIFLLASLSHAQTTEPEWRRLRNASEVEQRTWIRDHLCHEMPPSETFADLIVNRSSIALPVIEAMIEELIRRSTILTCMMSCSRG
jgi:hypothetical protein